MMLAVATATSGTNLPTRGDILWQEENIAVRGQGREGGREGEKVGGAADLGKRVEDQSCRGGSSCRSNKRNSQIPVSVSK